MIMHKERESHAVDIADIWEIFYSFGSNLC